MTLLSKSLLSTSLLLSSVSTSKDIHNPNVCPSLSLNINLNHATSLNKKNHATSLLMEYTPYNNWDMLTAQASGIN